MWGSRKIKPYSLRAESKEVDSTATQTDQEGGQCGRLRLFVSFYPFISLGYLKPILEGGRQSTLNGKGELLLAALALALGSSILSGPRFPQMQQVVEISMEVNATRGVVKGLTVPRQACVLVTSGCFYPTPGMKQR